MSKSCSHTNSYGKQHPGIETKNNWISKNMKKKKKLKNHGGIEGFKKQLSRYHSMAKGTGQNMIKPMVEGMGFGGAIKVINLDSFTCVGGFPKYESRIAVSLKLPRTHSCFRRIIKIIHLFIIV